MEAESLRISEDLDYLVGDDLRQRERSPDDHARPPSRVYANPNRTAHGYRLPCGVHRARCADLETLAPATHSGQQRSLRAAGFPGPTRGLCAVKDGVSGWLIGCADSDHDHNAVENLKKVTLYEAIVRHCPAALRFLGSPSGALISVEDEPVFFLNGERLAVRKDSFVDRQNARRVRAVS
jgi:hypothetical protein